jgi:hypothetical protein
MPDDINEINDGVLEEHNLIAGMMSSTKMHVCAKQS